MPQFFLSLRPKKKTSTLADADLPHPTLESSGVLLCARQSRGDKEVIEDLIVLP